MTLLRAAKPGFTLIEMILVLVILGLATGLIALRGPAHSAAIELQRATDLVVGAIKLARGQAIAAARPVTLRLSDAATLPPGIHASAPPITFRPDGSTSGGRVVLEGYGRHAAIEVSWLDGRISFPP